MNRTVAIGIVVILYVLSSWGSYAFFSRSNSITSQTTTAPTNGNGAPGVDTDPKTEECPLNGKLYSKKQQAKWEARRPLGIMVQNNIEARPQSGISQADIIHEAVAEGGITRFLALYLCEEPKIVGSVRSARMYFIRLLQGYGENPLYGHVGGANTPGPADALGEIKKLKWYGYNDMDQFAVPFPNYWRDYDRLPGRATEHTVYTNTQKLWEYAKKNRKLAYQDEDGVAWDESWKPWSFQDGSPNSSAKATTAISYGFWSNGISSDYNVVWAYDAKTNTYKRANGGKPHLDNNTDTQLESSNVIVAFAKESVANDGYEGGQHMLYEVVGTNKALIFQNGAAIEGTWKKPKATDMMRFYDEKGKEVELVRGQVWISVLPTGNEVTY